jgi:hypothetical protein
VQKFAFEITVDLKSNIFDNAIHAKSTTNIGKNMATTPDKPKLETAEGNEHRYFLKKENSEKTFRKVESILEAAAQNSAQEIHDIFEKDMTKFEIEQNENTQNIIKQTQEQQQRKEKPIALSESIAEMDTPEVAAVRALVELVDEIEHDLHQAMNDDELDLTPEQRESAVDSVKEEAWKQALATKEPAPEFLRKAFHRVAPRPEPRQQHNQYKNTYQCLNEKEERVCKVRTFIRENLDGRKIHTLRQFTQSKGIGTGMQLIDDLSNFLSQKQAQSQSYSPSNLSTLFTNLVSTHRDKEHLLIE